MDYLELIARVTSHIPDKGQVMVRLPGPPNLDSLLLDSQPQPGYPQFVTGRVDGRPRRGDFKPGEKRKFFLL